MMNRMASVSRKYAGAQRRKYLDIKILLSRR
jgi:hypothetical protein